MKAGKKTAADVAARGPRVHPGDTKVKGKVWVDGRAKWIPMDIKTEIARIIEARGVGTYEEHLWQLARKGIEAERREKDKLPQLAWLQPGFLPRIKAFCEARTFETVFGLNHLIDTALNVQEACHFQFDIRRQDAPLERAG